MIAESMISDLKKKLNDCELSPFIVCFLWYGSSKNRGDFKPGISDHDFHLVLTKLEKGMLEVIKEVFSPYDRIDLSVHHLGEIVSSDGSIIFQNGTQGAYFIHVLAHSEVIIGTNVYTDLVSRLERKDVDSSLRFKIREYLWRLRRMYVSGECNIVEFQKYSIRILKDVLLLNGNFAYSDLDRSNRDVVCTFIKRHASDFEASDTQQLSILVDLPTATKPNLADINFVLANIVDKYVK